MDSSGERIKQTLERFCPPPIDGLAIECDGADFQTPPFDGERVFECCKCRKCCTAHPFRAHVRINRNGVFSESSALRLHLLQMLHSCPLLEEFIVNQSIADAPSQASPNQHEPGMFFYRLYTNPN